MFCGCGVGSYRGKQSVGSNGDTYAYTKSDAQDSAYTTASSNTGAASYSSTPTYPDPNTYPDSDTGV
jgi:hypothetical protein